jgi:hypothetical protein
MRAFFASQGMNLTCSYSSGCTDRSGHATQDEWESSEELVITGLRRDRKFQEPAERSPELITAYRRLLLTFQMVNLCELHQLKLVYSLSKGSQRCSNPSHLDLSDTAHRGIPEVGQA